MIRRINKLKNVGRFAELRSLGGSQHEFTKVNVIYAHNGCGKTTFGDVLRSVGSDRVDFILGRKRFGSTTPIEIELLLHGSPPAKVVFTPTGWRSEPVGVRQPKTLVYDDRFVADNVLVGHSIAVEQRRNLYGLALGAQGKLLKETVDAAEQNLNNATAALNAARAALTPLLPTGFTIETFRTLPKDEIIDQRINQATAELELKRRTKQNAESIRRRKPLTVLNCPSIPKAGDAGLDKSLDDLALQAETKIRQHLERNSHGLDLNWLGQGYHGQVGTICPHCGQEMGELEILAAYRAFFSGALQTQQAELARILEETEERFGSLAQQQFLQVLNSHIDEQAWWKDVGGLSFDLPACDLESVRAAMEAMRSALTNCILRKQAQPTLPSSFSPAEVDDNIRWLKIDALVTSYMASIHSINVQIAGHKLNARTVDIGPIEQHIALISAQKKRHDPAAILSFDAFDTATATKAEKERAKVAANKALRDQSERVLREYGDRINALLERFKVEFRLVSGGVNFLGGPPAGELAIEICGTRVGTTPEDAKAPTRPSLANTLSGGDRSALGLAFFVAVAERDPDIGNAIVVFDDPFHSQDRSRRRRTIECVHRLASTSCQCFILSHELDFAREAARMVGVQVNTFTLDPMTDHLNLESKSFPSLPGCAYEQDYAKLTAYLRNPADYTGQLKDVARCIRQSLEGYLRTKFPESWAPDDWIGGMIGKIRDAQPGNVLHFAAHLVTELTEVNDWGKRYYHSEMDGSAAGAVDPLELKDYVDQTIKIISQ